MVEAKTRLLAMALFEAKTLLEKWKKKAEELKQHSAVLNTHLTKSGVRTFRLSPGE